MQEIQAAIDELTKLKNEPIVTALFTVTEADAAWFIRTSKRLTIFHRTIDAQLAILQNDMRMYSDYQRAGWLDQWVSAVERAGDLALARAINGTPQ